MSVDDPVEVLEHPCVNHPRTLTAVACGKCGAYLCTRCMVFTPVGVRCRDCAQLRRLPQYDVALDRAALAGVVTLAVATFGWLLVQRVFFVGWLLAIALGAVVGEIAGRITRRRANRALQVTLGIAMVAGFFLARALWLLGVMNTGAAPVTASDPTFWRTVLDLSHDPYAILTLILGTAIAVTRIG